MDYKILYILLEGVDDERFFSSIVSPLFQDKYSYIVFYKYASEAPKKIRNFLKSIKSMNEKNLADYYFVSDMDSNICITFLKDKLKNKFNIYDLSKIMIVIKEIECWYLAGLNNDFLRKYGISKCSDTCRIFKEDFNRLIPPTFSFRTDFMIECLKFFSIDEAKIFNSSFDYFINCISN